jgi:hypothetical protein
MDNRMPALPPALAGDERFALLCKLLWEQYGSLDIEKILVCLVDIVPEAMLPHLGDQFHIMGNEGWNLTSTVAQRRALIKRSIELHRTKGTPWAIKEALRALGFTDLQIVEHLPENDYDGSLAYDGGNTYGDFHWAQFRVDLNADDMRALTADDIARIVGAITEWKPARSHLVDVRYRGNDVEDAVTYREEDALNIEIDQADVHTWGRPLYDGSLAHDQGQPITYGGKFDYSGAQAHSGLTDEGEVYGEACEELEMSGVLEAEDRQQVFPLHGGEVDYSGIVTYGSEGVVALDLPMPIIVTRHREYDGTLSYSGDEEDYPYDGTYQHDGQIFYPGGITYSGDVITMLEA